MDAGAYYLLAFKGNQPSLNEAVRKNFEAVVERNGLIEEWTESKFEHTRWEKRRGAHYAVLVKGMRPGCEKNWHDGVAVQPYSF